MADNTTLNAGTGGDTIRDRDRSGVKTPVVALDLNPAGTETLMAGAMPVTGTFWQATQPVSGTVGVSGSVAVTGTFWQATQPVSGTVTANIGASGSLALDATLTGGAQKTKLVDSAGTNVATVSAAGAVKVDGSGVTQPVSGTVTVQQSTASSLKVDLSGTAANATALKVDGSAVTQPVSGTFWQATQPVSIAATVATSPAAATSGGATPYHLVSAASTNATSVKASAGVVSSVSAFNTNASPRYLKLFDKASAPTLGTDTPVLTYLIPPSNGGFTKAYPVGVQFSTGIALAITANMADTDNSAVGASDVCVNIAYK